MTSIEWTDAVWNPTVGCSRVSAGCERCYAERVAHRAMQPAHAGLTVAGAKGPRWTGEVRCLPDRLETPLRWRKPRRIFVNSMSDLFHEQVPDQFIDTVWAVMNLASQHTFQILTKRPERMRAYLDATVREGRILPDRMGAIIKAGDAIPQRILPWERRKGRYQLAPHNVWLGVSVEDQAAADERIPLLLRTPAAVRFVSAEPLLGPVDLSSRLRCQACCGTGMTDRYFADGYGPAAFHRQVCRCRCGGGLPARGLDWVICGGESGPGARACHVSWIRSVVEQCREAKVACFVKQIGARPDGWCAARLYDDDRMLEDGYCDAWEAGEGNCGTRCIALRDRKGADPEEWPADLRVREMPEARTSSAAASRKEG